MLISIFLTFIVLIILATIMCIGIISVSSTYRLIKTNSIDEAIPSFAIGIAGSSVCSLLIAIVIGIMNNMMFDTELLVGGVIFSISSFVLIVIWYIKILFGKL